MSTITNDRRDVNSRRREYVLRIAVPVLWLACLGYQWAFAWIVLDNVSQTVAFFFRVDLESSPTELWQLLCDVCPGVFLISWSIWLAACPRALTAVFSRREDLPRAQRRSVYAVLVALTIGLALQGAWLVAILRGHGSSEDMSERLYRHVLTHIETHLPLPHQLIASVPLFICIVVMALRCGRGIKAYDWLAACWAILILVQMNVAYGLSQARMLSHHVFGYEDRVATVGSFAALAVVVVALLLEYRQVWQAKLEGFANRDSGETPFAIPQPPAPSP
jgi:hypothetical protein